MIEPRSIELIRSLYTELASGRQDYDFSPPSMVSHVQDYRKDMRKLKYYSKQVISARIMMLLAINRMNTQSLLQCYLSGLEMRNPLSILLSTRSQVELLALVIETLKVVSDNAGEHPKDFADRVQRVDEALIKATYGTRSSLLKELFDTIPLSKKRPITQQDKELLNSRNVLSRLDKLAKLIPYKDCKRDYERLCEYVHPNYGMNMLRVVQSPIDERLLRFSMTSDDPMNRAITASADCMAQASRGTITPLECLDPPFGAGKIAHLE